MHFMHDVLKNLAKYSGRPLFKQIVDRDPSNPAWKSISYDAYLGDLTNAAGYWKHQLEKYGMQPSDIVGLWITGLSYTDLVHIYALIRAGFVPQVFNLGMLSQGSTMIEDLLGLSHGKALVYDAYYAEHLHEMNVPTCVIPDLDSILGAPHGHLDDLPPVNEEDIAMIFHTSGTTSSLGRPKPIPQTHKWLKCQAQVNWPGVWQKESDETQKCFNNIGSLANVGSATSISYLSASGQCIIQTSKPDFGATEFLAMVHREGLNNILLYANWFSKLLAIARTDNRVLDALRSTQQIAYTGEALNPEDLHWAIENKIPTSVLYASTETAICLVSDLHQPETLPAMHVIDGMSCMFLPHTTAEEDSSSNLGTLFDFFVPAGAANSPHISVQNRPDGHITGDLFEETQSGYYIFRGRNDDWIKTGSYGMFSCDTKAIEDNVKLTCADLVQNCVIVGTYKPIVLFVEPMSSITHEEGSEELKRIVVKRMEKFNATRFNHERIDSPLRVVAVEPGRLPRTKEKGNVRRKAVEETYADTLREIYSQLIDETH